MDEDVAGLNDATTDATAVEAINNVEQKTAEEAINNVEQKTDSSARLRQRSPTSSGLCRSMLLSSDPPSTPSR